MYTELLEEPFAIGGDYLVEEPIGARGGLLVFGARHQPTNCPVTVKVLHPAWAADDLEADRFVAAARAAGRLRHRNVVALLDFGYDFVRDLYFAVSERISGRMLADLIAEAAPLPWDRAARILIQLCRALHCGHVEGVVHRALHPGNVLVLDGSDTVKLANFGFTRSNTRAYLAPEQLAGQAENDPRIDLHALGVIAYELVTGRLPASFVPSVPGPAWFHLLVRKLLAHDPAARPPTAKEVEQQLLWL